MQISAIDHIDIKKPTDMWFGDLRDALPTDLYQDFVISTLTDEAKDDDSVYGGIATIADADVLFLATSLRVSVDLDDRSWKGMICCETDGFFIESEAA